MDINLNNIKIRELVEGFEDNGEGGVVGYGGNLDIRPPYQREFIYKGKQLEDVIDTVLQGFPLNSMYWAVRLDSNGKEIGFEVLDGQQRTLAICTYVDGDFPHDGKYFHNLQSDEKEKILNYKLMVYQCSGADSEKLKWFETINIAGETLTKQELRNSVYHCQWLADAKSYFSRTAGAAHNLAGRYLKGVANRQEYLETAIRWHSDVVIAGKFDDPIREYMARRHKENKPDAEELHQYFEDVIEWVEKTFITYRKEMKGKEWGLLYNKHKAGKFNPAKIEDEVAKLMEDEDVKAKKGIYDYVLTREERHLNIRAFDDKQKREAYERQKGICAKCKRKEKFNLEEMEADHIKPWSKGGQTKPENCQMLCLDCNRRKSNK